MRALGNTTEVQHHQIAMSALASRLRSRLMPSSQPCAIFLTKLICLPPQWHETEFSPSFLGKLFESVHE